MVQQDKQGAFRSVGRAWPTVPVTCPGTRPRHARRAPRSARDAGEGGVYRSAVGVVCVVVVCGGVGCVLCVGACG